MLAPVVTLMPALAAWAVMPFGPQIVLANVNAGLLDVDGHHFGGCLWRDRGGLGVEFEVRFPRSHACVGADGVV